MNEADPRGRRQQFNAQSFIDCSEDLFSQCEKEVKNDLKSYER